MKEQNKAGGVARQRGDSQPKTSFYPEKNVRVVNVKVTQSEYDDIHKYATDWGDISRLLRSAIRKWLVEKKRAAPASGETQEKAGQPNG